MAKQVNKYKQALQKCLEEYFPSEFPKTMPIECICVVGKTPDEGIDTALSVLRSVDARFITYDQLISKARQSYEEFLQAESGISDLIEIINSVDKDFATD